jgi:beta-N-acetylhexosaminidase
MSGDRPRVEAVGEATSLSDRKRRAGQRMIMGIPGPSVDEDTRRLIREVRPAGFILFARNVVDPDQVTDLNRELASLVDPAFPAIRSVDQEGGRVQRIRAPATVWPTMAEVGRAGSPTAASEVATGLSRELRAMGFDLNFAPVADVHSNPKNPVIGDRSFGTDPRSVAERVAAFAAASQAEGIIACAKHFPGHGDTSVDSHLELPVVEKEDGDLRRCELVPFAEAVAAGIGAIMTSHVVYPAWDEGWPATLSQAIAPRLLRQELAFDGVLFSDDLEMKALDGRWPLEDQLRRATLASVDVFLTCNGVPMQVSTFESLVRLQEESAAQDRAASEANRRVMAMRERFFVRTRPSPGREWIGHRDHQALADRIRARGAA